MLWIMWIEINVIMDIEINFKGSCDIEDIGNYSKITGGVEEPVLVWMLVWFHTATYH